MSLRPPVAPPVPEETARVARAAFPKGNLYLQLRDEIGVLFEDADFANLFPIRGQPAYAPWRLALITIFQFIENLSDRAASDARCAPEFFKFWRLKIPVSTALFCVSFAPV
jgi:transposase